MCLKKIWSAAAWQLEKQSCPGAKRFCGSDKQGGEPPASSGYVGRGLNHRVLCVPWKKRTQRNITQHGEMRRISRDKKMTERLKTTIYKFKNGCERKKLWVSLLVPRRSMREQVPVWRMLNRCLQEERNAHEIILSCPLRSRDRGERTTFLGERQPGLQQTLIKEYPRVARDPGRGEGGPRVMMVFSG